ncbi:MAG TPA: hypothetical protein PLL30_16975 [Candidatus Krumholzibacteria bacterium]|nr:hypothetical protein [Candidatus Krumholzibacteria bacterium]HPD73468.1 hypothetical protein [Candidatus Krumholzibacteria bacterium]HRY42191.1 hypothetical protein [Candidatus Krumholzibacteria bacterium]
MTKDNVAPSVTKGRDWQDYVRAGRVMAARVVALDAAERRRTKICPACGSEGPADQSCGCWDNHSE